MNLEQAVNEFSQELLGYLKDEHEDLDSEIVDKNGMKLVGNLFMKLTSVSMKPSKQSTLDLSKSLFLMWWGYRNQEIKKLENQEINKLKD